MLGKMCKNLKHYKCYIFRVLHLIPVSMCNPTCAFLNVADSSFPSLVFISEEHEVACMHDHDDAI